MKKVLSLVLAFTLVLGMMPTAFAAETGSAGEMLLQYKFISGGANGELMEDKDLTREQFAVILATLNGKEEEAAKFEGALNFKDADKISKWAVPYVAYAVEQEWMVGSDKNEFMPAQNLTGQAILSSLLNVLGYKVEWANVVKEAETLGFTATEGELNRGQAFETLWKVVKEIPAKGADQPLGVALGKLEAEKPVVTDLAIKKITADNKKAMTIEFNQPVDEETVTATTLKVTTTNGTNLVDSRLLSEDKTKVVVVYNTSVSQSTSVKVTVEGVATKAGQKLAKTEETVLVNDVIIPEIKGVVALNAKQIEVSFSEPMDLTKYSETIYRVNDEIKISGNSIIAIAKQDFLNNKVVFELSTLLEAKEHEVKITGMADYAGYKHIAYTGSVVVAKDDAAPVLKEAKVINTKEIEVTFDEAVFTTGKFWVNGTEVAGVAAAAKNTDKTKWVLTLDAAKLLDLAATVEIKVEYQGQKDVVNNEVKAKTLYTFKIEDDTTMPTASVEVLKANKIVVTFSKSMNNAVGTIQVMDKDKKAYSELLNVKDLTFKADTNYTVLEITGDKVKLNDVNPGTYFLNIKNMKDGSIRGNILAEVMTEFKALDTKAPAVNPNYSVKAGTKAENDTITFYFTESMDVETLKNLSNFILETGGNKVFASITGVSFSSASSDGKSVTFVYPSANSLNAETFQVYAVKDLAGNMVAAKTGIAKLSGAEELTITASSATAIAKDKIKIVFNNTVTSVDPSLIVITKAGVEGDYAIPTSASIGGDNNNEVTFTLNKSIGTTTTGYTVGHRNVTLITDSYGQTMKDKTFTITGANFVDKIKPEVASVKQDAANAAKIIVDFSEDIVSAGDFKYDLVVKNTTDDVTLVPDTHFTTAVANGNVEITIINATAGKKFSVQLLNGRYIADTSAAANKAVAFDAKTVRNSADDADALITGLVAPIVAYAKANDAAAMTVAELTAAGVLRVEAANLAAYKTAVVATTDDGTGVDTTAEIQTLVDTANVAAAKAALTNASMTYTDAAAATSVVLNAPADANSIVYTITNKADTTVTSVIAGDAKSITITRDVTNPGSVVVTLTIASGAVTDTHTFTATVPTGTDAATVVKN